jgi:hypothetical protein
MQEVAGTIMSTVLIPAATLAFVVIPDLITCRPSGIIPGTDGFCPQSGKPVSSGSCMTYQADLVCADQLVKRGIVP